MICQTLIEYSPLTDFITLSVKLKLLLVRTRDGITSILILDPNLVGRSTLNAGKYAAVVGKRQRDQGCQMAIARFLDHMCLALRASGLWLRYATLQNLIPSFPWIAPGWRASGNPERDSRHSVQFPLHCNSITLLEWACIVCYLEESSLKVVERSYAPRTSKLSQLEVCAAKKTFYFACSRKSRDSGWAVWAPLVKRRPSIFVSHPGKKVAWATKICYFPLSLSLSLSLSLFPGNFKQECRKLSGFNSLLLSAIE